VWGTRSVACGVDAAALLCLGGSEHVVFASICVVGGPGTVLRRFSVVVCCSEMGRPSDIVVVICDVADDAGGSERETGGFGACWDELGGTGGGMSHRWRRWAWQGSFVE